MKYKSTITGQENPIIDMEIGDIHTKKSFFTEEKISTEVSSTNLIAEGIFIIDIQMHFPAPQTS